MGSPATEPERNTNERQHEVCIHSDYEIGKYEVTQGQWKAVMGNDPSRLLKQGDDYPVERVSWNDVQDYLTKLNQKTGKQYRLPTEAEWEYAARAGTTTAYWWGSQATHENANYGKEGFYGTRLPTSFYILQSIGYNDLV
jgi:formylglycine-generating enzyme required for sulfatase activity